jgi:hypothetical protein
MSIERSGNLIHYFKYPFLLVVGSAHCTCHCSRYAWCQSATTDANPSKLITLTLSSLLASSNYSLVQYPHEHRLYPHEQRLNFIIINLSSFRHFAMVGMSFARLVSTTSHPISDGVRFRFVRSQAVDPIVQHRLLPYPLVHKQPTNRRRGPPWPLLSSKVGTAMS